MKQDESLALAALFDCWQPKWRQIDGPHGFLTDIKPALLAFGFNFVSGSPLSLHRMTKDNWLSMTAGRHDQFGMLCTYAQLRSPNFLHAFRRFPPERVILCAKSGLWWIVWDINAISRPRLHISTAEYLPSRA